MKRGQLCDADSYAMRMWYGHSLDKEHCWDANRWDEEQSWEANRWKETELKYVAATWGGVPDPNSMRARYDWTSNKVWRKTLAMLLPILLSMSEERALKKEKNEKIHWERKIQKSHPTALPPSPTGITYALARANPCCLFILSLLSPAVLALYLAATIWVFRRFGASSSCSTPRPSDCPTTFYRA